MYSYLLFAKFLNHTKNEKLVRRIKELYNKIPEDRLSTPIGKEITSYIYPEKIAKVGDTIPEVVLFDIDNNKRSLSEFKGRYTLLDFWSQGCGPCIESIPELKEISKIYKDKLNVVGICTDGERHGKRL